MPHFGVLEDLLDTELRMASPKASIVPTSVFGYVIVHDRNDTVVPLYFMPQEVQDSYSPNWNDQVIPGRSEPIRSYSHGGPRRVSCNLVFIAQGGSDQAPTTARDEVYDPVTIIRSAMYPRYGTLVEGPPAVTLQIGNFLQIRGILAQAEVRWMGPWDVAGGMFPMRAELTVAVDQVNRKALGRQDVLQGTWGAGWGV